MTPLHSPNTHTWHPFPWVSEQSPSSSTSRGWGLDAREHTSARERACAHLASAEALRALVFCKLCERAFIIVEMWHFCKCLGAELTRHSLKNLQTHVFLQTYTHAHVRSFIHSHPKQEATQMSISSRMNKQVVTLHMVEYCTGMKKDQFTNTCSRVGKSHGFDHSASHRRLHTKWFCKSSLWSWATMGSGVGDKEMETCSGLWLYQGYKWKKSLSLVICELDWV